MLARYEICFGLVLPRHLERHLDRFLLSFRRINCASTLLFSRLGRCVRPNAPPEGSLQRSPSLVLAVTPESSTMTRRARLSVFALSRS